MVVPPLSNGKDLVVVADISMAAGGGWRRLDAGCEVAVGSVVVVASGMEHVFHVASLLVLAGESGFRSWWCNNNITTS